jgi:hypothetical protein
MVANDFEGATLLFNPESKNQREGENDKIRINKIPRAYDSQPYDCTEDT